MSHESLPPASETDGWSEDVHAPQQGHDKPDSGTAPSACALSTNWPCFNVSFPGNRKKTTRDSQPQQDSPRTSSDLSLGASSKRHVLHWWLTLLVLLAGSAIATRNYAPRSSRRRVCLRRLLLVQGAEAERDLNLP